MTITNALCLDAVESMVFSPHFFKPIATAPILVTLGGAKPPEFHWQSDQFVKKWK